MTVERVAVGFWWIGVTALSGSSVAGRGTGAAWWWVWSRLGDESFTEGRKGGREEGRKGGVRVRRRGEI